MYKSQEIAENIRNEANGNNVKLKDMFQDLDISVNTLSNMKRSMPSVETLARIADYLGCSLDELMGRQKNNASADRRSKLHSMIDALSDQDFEQLETYVKFVHSQKKK